MSAMRAYEGPFAELSPPEQVLALLASVPRLRAKLQVCFAPAAEPVHCMRPVQAVLKVVRVQAAPPQASGPPDACPCASSRTQCLPSSCDLCPDLQALLFVRQCGPLVADATAALRCVQAACVQVCCCTRRGARPCHRAALYSCRLSEPRSGTRGSCHSGAGPALTNITDLSVLSGSVRRSEQAGGCDRCCEQY